MLEPKLVDIDHDDCVLEAGLWLGVAARGQGVGTAVVRLAINQARRLGAVTLTAETTAGNLGAQTALRRAGFTVDEPVDGHVHAAVTL